MTIHVATPVGGVAVPNTALTDVLIMDVSNESVLGIQIDVTGFALNGFTVQGRMNSAGSYFTLYSVAADYTSPTRLVIQASGDLTTQAVGSGWLIMNCGPLESIKFQAKSSNASGSGIVIKAGKKA